MNDDELRWHPERLVAALPAWVMVVGGTAASLIFAGIPADIGLATALIGFVWLLVRLHREPPD